MTGSVTDEDARLRLVLKYATAIVGCAELMQVRPTTDMLATCISGIRRRCDQIEALKYPEAQR